MNRLARRVAWLAVLFGVSALPATFAQAPVSKPVKVTISSNKTDAPERVLPLDPTVRVAYEYIGNMAFGVNGEGKRLTCGPGSANTSFKIDGQVFYPDNLAGVGNFKGGPGPAPQPLPAGRNKKPRQGMQTTWSRGDIKITMILEIVPGKPVEKNADGKQKRRMDTLLIKYLIENNDTKSHQVGVRVHIDTMCGNNDGCLFASPTTHPGAILDGKVFREKEVPDFIEMLEQPNLKNPGFKGVFTCKMGGKVEGPNKVILTSLGAFGDWDMQAVPAMGDSAAGFFWEPQEIRAKGQREVAFAIGQSIACDMESEGQVTANFGGSFEPNKEFTVTAYVDDPFEGQSLTLELPKGMLRSDGKDTQAVPLPQGENNYSIVMWKCRVQELGTHALRIRSSNGALYNWTITVSKAE